MKDHEVTRIINEARDIAERFGRTEQVRERLANLLVPVLSASTVKLDQLRGLRLWHWKRMLEERAVENMYDAKKKVTGVVQQWDEVKQDMHRQQANLHLGWVQVLNDFFPIGDTADKDDRRAK